jgi:hypothetical protein
MSRLFALLFLLFAAAPAAAFDVKAGVLHGDTEASVTCPRRCQNYGGWEREKFTMRDRRSTCSCRTGPLGNTDEANAGPVLTDPAKLAWACVSACERYGGWTQKQRVIGDQMVCGCKDLLVSEPKAGR